MLYLHSRACRICFYWTGEPDKSDVPYHTWIHLRQIYNHFLFRKKDTALAADRSKDVITSGFSTIWTANGVIISRLLQHIGKYSELQSISTEKCAIDTTAVPICFAVYFSYTVICRYCGTIYRFYWKFNDFKSVFAHSTPYFFRSFSISYDCTMT